jgi:hypothetical protein
MVSGREQLLTNDQARDHDCNRRRKLSTDDQLHTQLNYQV